MPHKTDFGPVFGDPSPQPSRPIRVIIPAKVAFNLGDFQKSIENLAERLVCLKCISGRNCFFELESDFVVNPQTLNVESLLGGGIRR